jgi:hypothetical protein
MSESTRPPLNSPDESSSEPVPALPAQTSARKLGWSLSIGLHLLGYAALLLPLFGSGAKQALFSPSPAATTATTPTTEAARQQVAELLHTQRNLQQIQARAQTEYQRWQREQARNAVPNVQKAVRAAGEAQQQAAQAQEEAQIAQQAVEQAQQGLAGATTPQQRTGLLTRMEQAASQLARTQERAQQAQERAQQAHAAGARNLEFVEGLPDGSMQAMQQAFDSATQSQAQAHAAQTHAAQTTGALAEQARGLKEGAAALAAAQQQAVAAQNKAQQAQHTAEQATQAAQNLQSAAAAAHAQSDQMNRRAAQTRTLADQQAAQHAQTQAATLAALALTAQMQAAQAEAQRAQRTAATQDADLRQRRLGAASKVNQQIASLQTAAQQAQQRAMQQPALQQAIRQLAAAHSNVESGPHPEHRSGGTQEGGPSGEVNGPPGSTGGTPDLNNLDLAQLYDTATNAERASLEAFRQIQARSASRAQEVSLERALAGTDATPPVRPALGNQDKPGIALFGDNSLSQEQREEAGQQIAAMSALAHQMLDRTRSGSSPQRHSAEAAGTAVALAALPTTAPSAHRIALATEEEGHAAKDLTGDVPGVGGSSGVQAPDNSSGKWSKRPLDVVPHTSMPLPSPPVAIQAIPGRVVGKGVVGAGWMFVDSWHTIGPFPNPQRQNINKPFPPESGVDLDAAYAGKDNRIVHWQWLQSSAPMLVPNNPEEYAIYYGYTELWFDDPADLWIAIGSDDKSTLWIEDQLVWVSSDVLKGWHIDEGLRKVHFKKGLNRVLFRLENGWRGVYFSLCLCLKPSPR